MKNFVIFIHGENYSVEVEGKIQLSGFFATRRAEAESEEEASKIVLDQLRNEPELYAATTAGLGVEPSINIKVAHEMPLEHKNEYTGFTFYVMEKE